VSASTSSVTAIDVSHLDVVRVLPTADEEGKVYLLTRDEPATKPSSSSCRYRIQTLEDVVADVSASTATQKKR